MSEKDVLDRIKQVMNNTGANSRREFAQRIGYDVSNFSQIMRGNRSAPRSLLNKISETYPEIDKAWLFEGIGDRMTIHVDDIPGLINNEERKEMKPRLPITAAAGKLDCYLEGVMGYECDYIPIMRGFPEYDFTMFIKGDSMTPKYESGDEIALKKVQNIVEWGKDHVLATEDGAIFKRIFDEGDSVRCVSYNKDYPDLIVPKERIYGYYKFVGLIRV